MNKVIEIPQTLSEIEFIKIVYSNIINNLKQRVTLSKSYKELLSDFGYSSDYNGVRNLRDILYSYNLGYKNEVSDLDAKAEIIFNYDTLNEAKDIEKFREYLRKFVGGEINIQFRDYFVTSEWSNAKITLNKIFVEDYKVLKKFSFSKSSDGVSILIGNNGSGKSSVIYLIAKLLASFHSYPKKEMEFNVKMDLEYTLTLGSETKKIGLINDSRMEFKPFIKINDSSPFPYDSRFMYYLPSNVVIHYSGITKELEFIANVFENAFVKRVKNNNSFSLNPFNMPQNTFYYSKSDYIVFIYISLLFSESQEVQDLLTKLDIDTNGCVFNFVAGKIYEQFKNKLSGKVAPQFFLELNSRGEDWELVGNLAVTDLFRSFNPKISPKEVFDVLFYLYHNELISKIDLSWGDDYQQNLFNLSEGQKQEILTLGLSLVFDNPSTLFLLDEPDTFLHPKWQREFISSLTKATANGSCAIVTTHSPLMLGNAEKAEVHILENGKLQENTPKYYGKDNNAILYDLMGVGRRVKAIEKKISLLSDFIEKEDLPNAQKLYNELEDLLEDDSDLIRANAMLDYLKDEDYVDEADN